MIIAVDDSGDPGLKLGKGSSNFFVIAVIFFKNNKDAENTSTKIRTLQKSLKWSKEHEFKFRKTSPEIRKLFLNEIKSCKFKASIFILDKKLVEGNKTFKKDASVLYNHIILKTIQSLKEKLENADFYIDGESGKNYRKNVKTYFRKNLPKQTLKNLRYKDSSSDTLIQLADMIAGAAHRSVERDKDSSYIEILNKHIYTINTEP